MNDKNSFEDAVTDLTANSIISPPADDSSLEALVLEEQTLARARLLAELGREPSQEEVDRWLNEQTEGY